MQITHQRNFDGYSIVTGSSTTRALSSGRARRISIDETGHRYPWPLVNAC